MPYIEGKDRKRFEDILTLLKINLPEIKTEGELNYLITKICHIYLEHKGEKYTTYNAILGALEGVKLELYRRKVSNYEDDKIDQNGDV